MGAADMVPGVSGGTIALIVGIYDRLIGALAGADPRLLRHVPYLHRRSRRREFIGGLRAMDIGFLLALGAGMGTAVLLISRVIGIALEAYTVPVYAFFFGLIAASAVVLFRDVHLDTIGRLATAVIGFSVAFLIAGATGTDGGGGLVGVFVAGAIAISAMVLPGISGAVFLLLLGQYEFMLEALTETIDGVLGLLVGAGPNEALIEAGFVVLTFLVGATVGLLTMARIVGWALEHHRMATMIFLVSLMVGALRLPTEAIIADVGAMTVGTIGMVGLWIGIGMGSVLILDYYSDTLTYVE